MTTQMRSMLGVGAAESAVSPAGVLAGYAGALLAATLGYVGVLSRTPPTGGVLAAATLAVLATAVTLSRVRLPFALRTGLALVLIALLLASAARGQLFLGGHVAESIEKAQIVNDRPRASGGVATIEVSGDGSKSSVWARDINEQLDAHASGDAPWLGVQASVSRFAPAGDGRTLLGLAWSLDGHGGHVRCGTLTVVARDPAAAAALIADSIEIARRRSARKGSATCP